MINETRIPQDILDGTSNYHDVIRWQFSVHKALNISTYRYNGWWSEDTFNALERHAVATYDLHHNGELYKRLYIVPAGHDGIDAYKGYTQITWVLYRDGEAQWHKMSGGRSDIYAI
jgi:hypothetical protein